MALWKRKKRKNKKMSFDFISGLAVGLVPASFGFGLMFGAGQVVKLQEKAAKRKQEAVEKVLNRAEKWWKERKETKNAKTRENAHGRDCNACPSDVRDNGVRGEEEKSCPED